jgi:hypothetical protein
LTLWHRLTRFLDHPILELSTNAAENGIRQWPWSLPLARVLRDHFCRGLESHNHGIATAASGIDSLSAVESKPASDGRIKTGHFFE